MSPKTLFKLLSILLLALLLSARAVSAQAPVVTGATLPYSGYLADASGKPVPDGRYDFIFTLYASEKGADPLWTESQTGVNVISGKLEVSLGQVAPLSKELAGRQGLWLETRVRGPQDAAFTLLMPRAALDAPEAVNALACPHNHFSDIWTGSNISWGVYLENTSTGDGLRAYSKGTAWNYAAVFGANIATTGTGTGVYGYSDLGSGVYANSTSGRGLQAVSTNNFAVDATGGGDASYADLVGDLTLGGNRGEVFAPGAIMEFFTNGFFVIDLDNDNNSSNQLEVWNGTETLVYKVDESGNTTATGTKSASVSTADYGQRLMYAVESPEVWFEDLGSATLEKGVITVPIEPVFAQTVNLQVEYHVFVTPLCQEPVVLYVTAKTPSGFTVKGVTLDNQPSNCAFDYRITARRLGYSEVRLAPADTTPDSRSQGVK